MPKFGSVFSNEGKGSANEGGDRRGGLTADEIASRLYPKPTDSWRKDEPSAETVTVEPAVATAPAEEISTKQVENERNDAVAAVETVDDGKSAAAAEPATLTMISSPAQAETPQGTATDEPTAPAERLVSVISRNSVFDGNYATDGDVRVEGEVRGDITCKGHVLICDGAAVNAKISATSVAVAGRLSGEVTCTERFEAQPTARITSQISTPRLVIQEGAVVDGQIRMGVQE